MNGVLGDSTVLQQSSYDVVQSYAVALLELEAFYVELQSVDNPLQPIVYASIRNLLSLLVTAPWAKMVNDYQEVSLNICTGWDGVGSSTQSVSQSVVKASERTCD